VLGDGRRRDGVDQPDRDRGRDRHGDPGPPHRVMRAAPARRCMAARLSDSKDRIPS
jgi:hypothetical protein